MSERYLASLYWGFVTVTTVGYGDITPENNEEKVFALFSCLIGCWLAPSTGIELASSKCPGTY